MESPTHAANPRLLSALAEPKGYWLSISVIALLFLTGCSTPVGTGPVPYRTAYHQIDRSALNSRKISNATQQVLNRYDLGRRFHRDPGATLDLLHQTSLDDNRTDLLLALAELSYFHAEDLRRSVKPGEPRLAPDRYLSACVYAYLYLLGSPPEAAPSPFDRRFRLASDLYNRALAQGFTTSYHGEPQVELEIGHRQLPPGPLRIQFEKRDFPWDLAEIQSFIPADALRVRGLSTRNRDSGLGAPLIARAHGPQLEVVRNLPTVVFLRIHGDQHAWSSGDLTATLELFSSYDLETIEIAGRRIPLEGDTTAPIAYALNDSSVWRLGPAQFFTFEEIVKSGIYLSQPYAPGRIPVVFVHGTFSSPVWWAEMRNTLCSDPLLRQKFQFWYYLYNSGNPISHSAANLRDAIRQTIQKLDPSGTDPALTNLVVIGHSQGGLLAKLTATETGDQLWRAALPDFDQKLVADPAVAETLRRNFVFHPVPAVKRVIFICTPHRGSFLATGLIRNLARRLMKMPSLVARTPEQILTSNEDEKLPTSVRHNVPTSLDGMSPRNPWLQALAEIPVAPHVTAHSIIAIRGQSRPPRGSDGVVKYTSAHVDYATSEHIVRSNHGCQTKPSTIEEVRRILVEHLGTQTGSSPGSAPSPSYADRPLSIAGAP